MLNVFVCYFTLNCFFFFLFCCCLRFCYCFFFWFFVTFFLSHLRILSCSEWPFLKRIFAYFFYFQTLFLFCLIFNLFYYFYFILFSIYKYIYVYIYLLLLLHFSTYILKPRKLYLRAPSVVNTLGKNSNTSNIDSAAFLCLSYYNIPLIFLFRQNNFGNNNNNRGIFCTYNENFSNSEYKYTITTMPLEDYAPFKFFTWLSKNNNYNTQHLYEIQLNFYLNTPQFKYHKQPLNYFPHYFKNPRCFIYFHFIYFFLAQTS